MYIQLNFLPYFFPARAIITRSGFCAMDAITEAIYFKETTSKCMVYCSFLISYLTCFQHYFHPLSVAYYIRLCFRGIKANHTHKFKARMTLS